jgi:hypothetical protein
MSMSLFDSVVGAIGPAGSGDPAVLPALTGLLAPGRSIGGLLRR